MSMPGARRLSTLCHGLVRFRYPVAGAAADAAAAAKLRIVSFAVGIARVRT